MKGYLNWGEDGLFRNFFFKKNDCLKKNNYLKQSEKKELQLDNLQLQINSHFLYNALEMISSLAALNQVFVICDLCQMLGEDLRYSLGKDYGEFVTLGQELSHVRNYTEMQKICYGERFNVSYRIDVDPFVYLVPRFILQPIVENAVKYGLSGKMNLGIIEIAALIVNGEFLIRVTDDGVGMNEKKLHDLQNFIDSADSPGNAQKNIGVRNVNRRIRLIYGGKYGVRIESREGKGSRFTIALPVIEKERETADEA